MTHQIDLLLIATRNPAKEARYREIFARYTNRVIGLGDITVTGKPEEHGETAEENAEIKARFYASKAGCVAFAEDEALSVDFLPEALQPGVHVRRINGIDEASDGQLLAHWEVLIAGVPQAKRTGSWHVAYYIAHPDGTAHTFALDFPIRFYAPSSPVRIPGWPMSSLEGPVEFHKPHSELTDEEKRLANQRIDQAVAKTIQKILAERAKCWLPLKPPGSTG